MDDAELLDLRAVALRAARSILGDSEDVHDVAQVSVAALYVLRSVPPDEASAWIWRTACRRSIDVRRRRGRARDALPRLAALDVAGARYESLDSEALIARVAFDELIGNLSPRQRQVFELRFVDALPRKEISTRLGIGEDAVKSHLLLGLRRLRAPASMGDRNSASHENPLVRQHHPDRLPQHRHDEERTDHGNARGARRQSRGERTPMAQARRSPTLAPGLPPSQARRANRQPGQ